MESGGFVAPQGLPLSIARGMALGLLGENGAGKSTLVRLVLGFIAPSAGIPRVLGERMGASGARGEGARRQ